MTKNSEPRKLEERGGSLRLVHALQPRLVAAFKFLIGDHWRLLFLGIAVASWLLLTPDLSHTEQFSAGWVALLLLRNTVLLVAFTSAFYLPLYVRRTQGLDHKYNNQWLSVNNPKFRFQDQLWDNVFWSLCSGVPIWTAYEAVTLWLQTNGIAPTVSWEERPAYCILLTVLTPVWAGIHFYFTHRLIHWSPLYKSVHYLHHKNINIGPWSGLAMHPVEHAIYFSAVILFWVIPSHPFHGFFILQILALAPTLTHNGFDKIVLGSRSSLNTSHQLHYLHHKFVSVNFGPPLIDKWFGTFYDGSAEGRDSLKKKRRAGAAGKDASSASAELSGAPSTSERTE